jgi:hypothetical protein
VAAGDVNHDGFADIITGAGAGGGPQVRIFSGFNGAVLGSFFAFNPNFIGGVRVAAGDVNHDGFADVIAAAGAGGGPEVKVYDGATGNLIGDFFAYPSTFSGGVYVASADVNGDGFADIITGPGPGGPPLVNVFSGFNSALIGSFYAYPPSFLGGVRVAAADYGLVGFSDIITAPGPGGIPEVVVYDGATAGLLAGFFAYASNYSSGVFVGGG